jgi:hypothetical protein
MASSIMNQHSRSLERPPAPASRPRARHSGLKLEGALLCLLPWGLAQMLQADPTLSWLVAWLGSLVILLAVWTGCVFDLPLDRPLRDQVLRPWMLAHAIFAGYTFLTAIFYWLNLKGITFGLAPPPLAGETEWAMAARIQRHYVLAHAGLAIGYGVAISLTGRAGARVQGLRSEASRDMPRTLLRLTLLAVAGLFAFSVVPGLAQVSVKLRSLAVVAVTVGFGVALQRRSVSLLPLGLGVVFLFLSALASGWKEEMVVVVLLVAAAFFPRLPKTTCLLTSLVLFLGMVVLPPITTSIRENQWEEGLGKRDSLGIALDTLRYMSADEFETMSWGFLTSRLTEAGMFAQFMSDVPARHPYYGMQLVKQAGVVLVPRIFWPGKPNVEETVMARTREHGVVSADSKVSAKPAYLVDCYLSAGLLGVFLGGLLLGCISQLASAMCERYFGGYLLGGVIFNGLFSILWRGNCFEFTANALLWSFVLAWLGHWVFAALSGAERTGRSSGGVATPRARGRTAVKTTPVVG